MRTHTHLYVLQLPSVLSTDTLVQVIIISPGFCHSLKCPEWSLHPYLLISNTSEIVSLLQLPLLDTLTLEYSQLPNFAPSDFLTSSTSSDVTLPVYLRA